MSARRRIPRRWFAALLLIVPFLVPIPGRLERMHVLRSLGVLAHFSLPLLLTLILYRMGPVRGRLGPAAVAAFALTAGCELVQAHVGRHPRWQDAGVDLTGVLSGVGWTLSRVRARRIWLLLPVAGCLSTATILRDVPRFALAEVLVARHFPRLADFEDGRENVLWGNNVGEEGRLAVVEAGGGRGHVLLLKGEAGERYPGAIMRGMPRDWTGYARLVFDARVVRGGPLVLAVRLDDFKSLKDGVWLGEGFRLDGNWKHCVIDLDDARQYGDARTFRLDDLDSMLFYVDHPQRDIAVQLDDVSLE